ncbi:hypothetical protein ACKUB1_03565 [Methanospirillum stamsii]|uniref:Uncharacterized protein n=1 Tax=Methanospirillum stamsii TaxID=1277351 RepID=A0A2V2NI13_9EURY|nr:hypothetical protein [Methanospirillum stamsii]PWR76008.1 hypothetical protein DLD82_01570 [Methanospirillum stamsii]
MIKKIVFEMVLFFILLSGIVSADRLPYQVPENQKISISTIIDVVGFVSDSSSMSWTIDYSETPVTTSTMSSLSGAHNLTSNQLTALASAKSSTSGLTYSVDSGVLSSITVPDYLLDDLALPDIASTDPWWGMTWRGILDSLDSSSYAESEDTLTGSIHDGKLIPGESIAIVTFADSIRTNGGHLMLNKDLGFDSQNKGNGLSNLEVEKVLTYESIDGSFLVGSEEWSLDVAGNFADTDDSIRCVFASAKSDVLPAFCNVVKAKSELINFNSGQVSTKGGIRAVAASSDVPAALFYQIAVTPVSGSSSGFAEGTVKTSFAGSIMEARGDSDEPSATNQWSDKASVSGGIKNFQKSFGYESGFSL